MNKLTTTLLLAGFALASPVRADGLACNNSCTNEHQQCIAHLGTSASGNCGDGYRLCVQRCDPQRMNSNYLESDAVRRSLQQHVASTSPQKVTATP